MHYLPSIGKVVNDDEYRVSEPNRHWIKTITFHPGYHKPKFANNIALWRLNVPSTVTPICLAPMGSVFPEIVSLQAVRRKRISQITRTFIRYQTKRGDFRKCRQYRSYGIVLDMKGSQMCTDYDHIDSLGNCSHYQSSIYLQYVTTKNGRYFLAGLGRSSVASLIICWVFSSMLKFMAIGFMMK